MSIEDRLRQLCRERFIAKIERDVAEFEPFRSRERHIWSSSVVKGRLNFYSKKIVRIFSQISLELRADLSLSAPTHGAT